MISGGVPVTRMACFASPLTHLLQTRMSTGAMPNEWFLSIVVLGNADFLINGGRYVTNNGASQRCYRTCPIFVEVIDFPLAALSFRAPLFCTVVYPVRYFCTNIRSKYRYV